MDTQDQIFVDALYQLFPTGASVEDAAARDVFTRGAVLFDVSPGGRRLDAFFRKNLDLKSLVQSPAGRKTDTVDAYCKLIGIIPDRPVHFVHRRQGGQNE